MVIDINKLTKAGKFVSEFSCEKVFDENLVDLPNASIKGGVKVCGTVTIESKKIYIDGFVEYTVAGECSRCLEPAEHKTVQPLNIRFVQSSPEEDDYLYKSGLVDLTQAVRDAVLESMPFAIHCKEDCKGLCPICGCNLNVKSCNCEK